MFYVNVYTSKANLLNGVHVIADYWNIHFVPELCQLCPFYKVINSLKKPLEIHSKKLYFMIIKSVLWSNRPWSLKYYLRNGSNPLNSSSVFRLIVFKESLVQCCAHYVDSTCMYTIVVCQFGLFLNLRDLDEEGTDHKKTNNKLQAKLGRNELHNWGWWVYCDHFLHKM